MIRINLIDSTEVQFKLNDIPDLSIPASISALHFRGSPSLLRHNKWEDYAIEIIQTAVLWLIALKLIKVHKVSFSRSFLSLRFQRQTVFLLSMETKRADSCGGWLENEILRSIALMDCRRVSDVTLPGAFIDKVVWSLIGSSQAFPSHQVVHSVQLDAQRSGWGTSQGLVSPQFHPVADRMEELVCEQQKSRSLVDMFGSDYPEFNRALNVQIRKGIRSRLRILIWDNV